MKVYPEKVAFLQGLLAGLASNGQVVLYDEVRRLCRLNSEQLGTYLGEARKGRAEGEPDFCAVVVGSAGIPGEGWGSAATWAQELQKAHRFWNDRRQLDNQAFEERHGLLPAVPRIWE